MGLAVEKLKQAGHRFKTRVIEVGNIRIGGDHPVVVQSMTTTDTMDIEKTVEQVKQLSDVGCEIVRITAPTIQDAEALRDIRDQLRKSGYEIPLVADIHFVPAAAMIAADFVEKVRINPGNYADRKMFKVREYTESEYKEEIERIHEKFKPLVLKLKNLNRALRIGTNHGSLSDRIMNRFGDTPEGMVESAFEFAEICRLHDFHNFCFSMKASNVSVMIQAYRLLVERQKQRDWNYPIHLGVTEAGFGEDARIKSSIGIGTLLSEGIGDTIRVSLTEASVNEVPVGRALRRFFPRTHEARIPRYDLAPQTDLSKELPEVWLELNDIVELRKNLESTQLRPDTIYVSNIEPFLDEFHLLKLQLKSVGGVQSPKIAVRQADSWWNNEKTKKRVLAVSDYLVSSSSEALLEGKPNIKLVNSLNELFEVSQITPSRIVFNHSSHGADLERIIGLSTEAGSAFIDLPLKGLMVQNLPAEEALNLSFGILQATRRRMSKTEYISCPSCGRTLFDLEETTARIKAKTSHLKGVKIAVMGCIVNGPGEMADADFGYVGGAPGRVNLYVGKECVERNIASEEAPQRLVDLIKKHDRWIEPI